MDITTASKAELATYIAQLETKVHELEQQQQSDQFLLDTLRRIPISAIIVSATDGKIIQANDNSYPMFRYDDNQLLNQPLQALIHDTRFASDLLLQPEMQHNWEGEILANRRDETQFWCYVSATSNVHPLYGDVILIIFYDIDELIRARLRTLKSEALYLSLVDTLPQLIFRTNLNGRILFINQAIQEFLDVPFRTIVGKLASDVLGLFATSPLVVDDSSVLVSEETIQASTVLARNNNRNEMYISITKIPVFDENGNIRAVQTIIEDTTERTHAIQNLRASQRSLELLIQQIPIGIQVFDKDGTCTDVNETHLHIFACKREQLVNIFNIFDDVMAFKVETVSAARRALKGETVLLGDVEFDFSGADERYASKGLGIRIINVTIFPIFDYDNDVIGFVGINVDVTERKQREQHLQLSEERYRAVVEDQREMISRYLPYPDCRLTFVNQAYCDLTGMPEEELIGSDWRTLVSDELQEQILHKLTEISYETPTVFRDEKKITPDGSVRWIQWVDRGIFDADGNIVEYQGLGVDITEKKNLEAQQFAVTLEKERINILSEFVIRASHEFRTPLSIINSSAYNIARQPDPQKRMDRLERINHQITHISKLVDTMTLMSRLDRDLSSNEIIPSDMNRMLEIACVRLQSTVGSNSPILFCNMSRQPIRVLVAESDFVRVIELLGENALKFSRANDTVSISSNIIDGNAVVVVADTGVGMSEETREHVFNRFYRADDTGVTPGLGLGLPIAKAIIRQFDGVIAVESELGVGTTVTVTLPLAE